MDLSAGQVIAFAMLLFLSGAFSGAETALTSMTRLRVQQLIDARGARALPLQAWIDHPERYLTTLLIGNNLVNVGTSALATVLMASALGPDNQGVAVLAATFLVTLLILVFGEITPKHFCKRHAGTISMIVIRPLQVLAVVLRPAEIVLSMISRVMIFVLSLGQPASGESFGEAELRAAVELSGETGVIEKLEQSIISRVLKFGDSKIREIMVPRVKMTTVSVDAPRAEVAELVTGTGHRRIPVYEENRDRIVGIVHVHDLLKQVINGQPLDLRGPSRPPVFVPESKPVDEMLAFFRKERVHMAIVVNEYGGVEGLVTLEDVLEELVGEIEDEHDAPVRSIEQLADGRMVLEGSVELKEVERLLEGVELEGAAVSLGGWMIEQLGRIPQTGESVDCDGWRFTVAAATDKIVVRVEAEQLDEGEEGEEAR